MTNDVLKQIWPEWEIEETPLGRGSFGVVYKAVRKDHNVESYAAIKAISIPSDPSEVDSLRSEGLDIDATKTFLQSIVDDFVNEIQLMESLKGAQNIVSIEDYKVVEKTNELGWDIYIRMELLVPFNTYISDKKLTEKEVIKLGCDICTALEICAKRNIIHRDIKLENIFVSGFGDFKLGDFGVARMLENTTGGLSQKGAPNYMAPEVALGEKYDFRVDIYSLGIVLYRLLNANRLPFLDTERQLLNYTERKNAIERRLRGEAFNAPRDASLEMSDVILRACAYDPNKRFSSATEMKHALMSVANGTYQVGGASDPDGTISVHRIPAVSDKQADEPISPEIVASELNSTISVHRISAAPDQQVDEPASSVVEASEPDGTISVRKVPETSDRKTEHKVNTFGSLSNDENKRKKLKKIIAIASAAGAACVVLIFAFVLLPPIINRPALEVANGEVSSTSEESVVPVSSSTTTTTSSSDQPVSSSTTTTTSTSLQQSPIHNPPSEHQHQYAVTKNFAATCEDAGYKVYVCSCGDQYTENTDEPLKHSYTKSVTKPTCTENGYTKYTCSRCGYEYTLKEENTPALGHDWGEWKVIKSATALSVGEKQSKCSRCGETVSETIPKLKDTSAYTSEVVRLVNAERAKEGLSPLAVRADLSEYAQLRSTEIVSNFAHQRPDDSPPLNYVMNLDGIHSAGENIAYGQKSPESVMEF